MQEQLGTPLAIVEDLFLRHVYLRRRNTIGSLSESMALAYSIVERVFDEARSQRLLEISAMVGDDYVFSLTMEGRAAASACCSVCRYAGPAPVSLAEYQKAMVGQRPTLSVSRSSLLDVLSDLVVTNRLVDQLGTALTTQEAIFLFGPSGVGKSTLAERLRRVLGDTLAIPYAIEVDSQIIVLFDPEVHREVRISHEGTDPRWVVCERPCVIVGGELVPSMLELRIDQSSGTYVPPVQMKANGGVLVIDDFGRQIISPRELLNRWIVPLDRRIDYLSLHYGVRLQIPFEVTVVFATNLDPRDLADEAFLRRIPNKIRIGTIDPRAFDEIFQRVVSKMNMPCQEGASEHLRNLCATQSGDLKPEFPEAICRIVRAIKTYEQQPFLVTHSDLDRAVELYFGAELKPGAAVSCPIELGE
jgi:energy-coupling factor transporter ATP-binding protein EcfA2